MYFFAIKISIYSIKLFYKSSVWQKHRLIFLSNDAGGNPHLLVYLVGLMSYSSIHQWKKYPDGWLKVQLLYSCVFLYCFPVSLASEAH